jgi:hypothetical protein
MIVRGVINMTAGQQLGVDMANSFMLMTLFTLVVDAVADNPDQFRSKVKKALFDLADDFGLTGVDPEAAKEARDSAKQIIAGVLQNLTPPAMQYGVGHVLIPCPPCFGPGKLHYSFLAMLGSRIDSHTKARGVRSSENIFVFYIAKEKLFTRLRRSKRMREVAQFSGRHAEISRVSASNFGIIVRLNAAAASSAALEASAVSRMLRRM